MDISAPVFSASRVTNKTQNGSVMDGVRPRSTHLLSTSQVFLFFLLVAVLPVCWFCLEIAAILLRNNPPSPVLYSPLTIPETSLSLEQDGLTLSINSQSKISISYLSWAGLRNSTNLMCLCFLSSFLLHPTPHFPTLHQHCILLGYLAQLQINILYFSLQIILILGRIFQLILVELAFMFQL